ncbi:autotransporter outer membrane beta-barrel domain-containing protein [Bordetella pseudohinzii]|uniref:Autotransporter outer membrane beta-barrel domain-containing protein n=2 Tax=Bordetella pseudohinzii TaxID=1331258 RepID=A0A0J6CDT1_9BORD|nr:autotransporter outer membrane beta-barrel domain-containing protein [Bordetella pseudohinzii]KMM27797.1 conjugal transfer protein TraC [Bordetella pseudohinzii]KXA81939.1 autotransporter outer membrane beta-barrel domain-containing protein [Bordetella pseudohinzii]KXA82240.1 autotransporter outer membrane beta-barrel domain-containing protein [Bordetella pseudohinzii]CUI30178.1 P.94 [Bordetella pseudohinzii]
MHSASMGIWLAEMNALSKRMGELRLTPAASGVWGRAFGQHQHLKVNAADRLSQTVEGIEIGADKGWSVRRGRWYVGGVAGYSHARRKWDHSARGDSDSVHVGAYATYIGDSGFYVDGIVRVNRYKHDVKVSHARGTRGGNYRANGAGLSLEAGKRISWGSDWFVEPQLEMAVLHLGGAHYTASNGMHVDIKSLKSVMGRVGLQLGRKFDLGGGKAVQPYAKLSWLQEFDGVAKARTADMGRHHVRLRGGRTELDLGLAAALGRNSSLFASYEYSKGARISIPWSFHVGYRYTW